MAIKRKMLRRRSMRGMMRKMRGGMRSMRMRMRSSYTKVRKRRRTGSTKMKTTNMVLIGAALVAVWYFFFKDKKGK